MKPNYSIFIVVMFLLLGGLYFYHSSKNTSPEILAENIPEDSATPPVAPAASDSTGRAFSAKQPVVPRMAKEVLNKLCSVYGGGQYRFPGLKVFNDDLRTRYRQSENTIILDETILEVCRSFGKDSLSALAFVIGHELAHFFQEKGAGRPVEFSYLAYDKNRESSPEKERLADIQGIFNAYLAGYLTDNILPKLISRIYKTYRFPDKLGSYPSLQERQQSAAYVLGKVDTLIQLYETANYLSAFGQYELAAASYQYILQYYPGREIYNNLGASYALHAIHCSKKSPDAFLYPLEIDTDSRLKRPKERGGVSGLPEKVRELRRQLLAEAARYLGIANEMDPGYFPASLNMLCVLTLQGKFQEAIKYAAARKLTKNERLSSAQKNRASLALAIALSNAESPADKDRAGQIFQELAASKKEPGLAYLASYNLKALQNAIPEKQSPATAYDCLKPFDVDKVDDVLVNRIEAESLTPLPGNSLSGFFYKKMQSSTVIQFSQSGKKIISFQRMTGAANRRNIAAPSFTGKHPRLVQTPSGFFLVCEEEHSVFLFGSDKRLVEWGRFYEGY